MIQAQYELIFTYLIRVSFGYSLKCLYHRYKVAKILQKRRNGRENESKVGQYITFTMVVCFVVAMFFNDFGIYTVFNKAGLIREYMDDRLA